MSVGSKSDEAFIQKIIGILKENGLRCSFKDGQMIIIGGDDENVKFEYYY
ncbi:hypothetical protein M0Q97_12825 [Candidatus Dojkabacteria bacterium]|jgi:hypothetical protein|nr:hypothetical protein [Candidatus Dojkabacteria bacterium]